MNKLLVLAVVTLAAVAAAPVAAPASASAPGAHHKEFVEFVVGPFDRQHQAHEEAHRLRERGFHTEVFHVEYLGWQVRAWRRA